MILRWVPAVCVLVTLMASTSAYRGGLDSCTASPSHGSAKSSSARATVSVLNSTSGTPVTQYVPGQQYTVRVARTGKFRGMTLRPYRGTSRGSAFGAGTLSAGTNARGSSGCSQQITHSDAGDKTTAEGSWTAPTAGTGIVSLWASVVTTYSDEWEEASVAVQERIGPSVTPSATPSATQTPSTSPTATSSPSGAPSSSASASVAPSANTTPSGTPSATPCPSPSASGLPSATPSASLSSSPTASPSSSARPSPPARGRDALKETARVVFALSQPLPSGTSPASFSADLAAELASVLALPAHRIGNVTVVPGSTEVTLLVLPPTESEYAPESVGSVAARTASALSNASLAASLGAASPLSFVNAGAPVSTLVGRSYADLLLQEERQRLQQSRAYAHSVSLGPDDALALRWSIEDSALAAGGRVLRAEVAFSHDSWAAVGFKRAGSGPSGMDGVWGVLVLPTAAQASERAQEITVHNTTLGGVVPRPTGELLLPAQMSSATAGTGARALSAAGGPSTHRVAFQRSLASRVEADWGVALPDGGEVQVVFAFGTDAAESASLSAMRRHQAGKAGQVLVDLGTGGIRSVPLGALGVVHGVVMFLVWYLLMPAAVVLATLSRALPKGSLTVALVTAHMRMQAAAVALCVLGFVLAVVLSANRGGVHFASPHQVMGLLATLLPIINAGVGTMRPPKGAKGRGRWLALHRALAVLTLLAGAITLPLGLAEAGADSTLLAVSVVAGIIVAVGVPAFAATCKPSHLAGKAAATIKSSTQRGSIVSGMNPLAVAHGVTDRGSTQNPLAGTVAPPPPAITITKPAEAAVLVAPRSPRDSDRSPEDIIREYEANSAKAAFRPITSAEPA